ncbi:HNH endonuclease [Clostridiisalibacter paucivorans]|uniref:HNH endonuclease n=1 Tax=Clostridiisalibacter paucivorans TaxID=408753 RepID=UPI0005536684|nr:HNH endonuclease [Clostridiisalibacter paucivorans]
MKIKNRDKLYIYYRDNKRCFYCEKKLKYKQMTLDHYLPRSSGGIDEIFNLVVSCKRCNRDKGDTIPIDVYEIMLILFLQGVKDGKITGKDIDISNRELKKYLLEVEKVEGLNREIVFQSKDKRFYIKDGYVNKMIHFGGKKH